MVQDSFLQAQRIEDEHGRRWVVQHGDPAYSFVTDLTRHWFAWIVLPTVVLSTGNLPDDWSTPPLQGENVRRLIECLGVMYVDRFPTRSLEDRLAATIVG